MREARGLPLESSSLLMRALWAAIVWRFPSGGTSGSLDAARLAPGLPETSSSDGSVRMVRFEWFDSMTVATKHLREAFARGIRESHPR
jgi:hypothetical protein